MLKHGLLDITKNGYEIITYGKYRTFVHRLMIMQNTKCQIPKGFSVHHIDGNKLNNNIDNLLLLDKQSHKQLHKRINNNVDR
jgi:hypothetical protein